MLLIFCVIVVLAKRRRIHVNDTEYSHRNTTSITICSIKRRYDDAVHLYCRRSIADYFDNFVCSLICFPLMILGERGIDSKCKVFLILNCQSFKWVFMESLSRYFRLRTNPAEQIDLIWTLIQSCKFHFLNQFKTVSLNHDSMLSILGAGKRENKI